MAPWIESFSKSLGLSIAKNASLLMAAHLGNNLDRIAKEIEKIQNNLKGDTEINLNHIQKYVGINREFNVFEFTKGVNVKGRFESTSDCKLLRVESEK